MTVELFSNALYKTQKFIFWLSVTPFKHLKSLRCMDFAVKRVKTMLFSDWMSKPHVGDKQFIKFLQLFAYKEQL